MRKPARNTVSASSSHTGHTAAPRDGRSRAPIQTQRASAHDERRVRERHRREDVAVVEEPQRDRQRDEREQVDGAQGRTACASRRARAGRARRTTSHNQGSLIFAPPNAPLSPRAIPHATCGPVNASVTSPLASSTVPFAISPAAPDQTFTVQSPRLYVASVSGFGGYRFSQSRDLRVRRGSARSPRSASDEAARRTAAGGTLSGFVVVVVVPARAAGTSASAATAIASGLSCGTTRACSR